MSNKNIQIYLSIVFYSYFVTEVIFLKDKPNKIDCIRPIFLLARTTLDFF